MSKIVKGVLGALGVVGMGVLAVVVSALNKDEFGDFLKKATDEELDSEREKVRLDYCNPNLDDGYRTSCRSRLDAFDDEMSKRAWGNETPHAPSYHREHGWYLPNDD